MDLSKPHRLARRKALHELFCQLIVSSWELFGVIADCVCEVNGFLVDE